MIKHNATVSTTKKTSNESRTNIFIENDYSSNKRDLLYETVLKLMSITQQKVVWEFINSIFFFYAIQFQFRVQFLSKEHFFLSNNIIVPLKKALRQSFDKFVSDI